MTALPIVDEVEPPIPAEQQPLPQLGIIAMITEPDGTDRSSRIALPADSNDAAIMQALREVTVSVARLRGIQAVANEQGAAILREWTARHVINGQPPSMTQCGDLLLRLMALSSV